MAAIPEGALVNAALAIFVKTPGLSPVKTRLAATVGAAAAEQFHRLAAMAVGAVARSVADSIVPYWAVAEREGCGAALWQEFPTIWQGAGGLGDRLHRVYATLLKRYDRVLLIGADAPQITGASLLRCVAELDDPAISFVIGPSQDGGFWLFGGRTALRRSVWCSISYSRATTCVELADAITRFGQIVKTERVDDVDTAEDLRPILRALIACESPVDEQRWLAAWIREQLSTSSARHRQARERNGMASSAPRRT